MNNCCKWKESDKLEGTSEGWSGRKLGLIAGGRLTEHLSPPPYPHLKKVYTISAGLPHTIMSSPGIRHALKYSLVMGGFSCGIVSRQIATDKTLNINAHRIYLYKLTYWSWAANTGSWILPLIFVSLNAAFVHTVLKKNTFFFHSYSAIHTKQQ